MLEVLRQQNNVSEADMAILFQKVIDLYAKKDKEKKKKDKSKKKKDKEAQEEEKEDKEDKEMVQLRKELHELENAIQTGVNRTEEI